MAGAETLQVRTLLTAEHRLASDPGRSRLWSFLRVRCGRGAGGPGLWSGGRIYSRLVWVQHLHLYFLVVFWRHYWPLLGISVSLFLCVWQGGVEHSWLDPSFFRGIGLLIAVLLSFRTKNAVSLRQRTGACVLRMLAGARSLLHFSGRGPGGKDGWIRMHWVLSMAFVEAADWLVLHSEKAGMVAHERQTWGAPGSVPGSVTDRDLEECFVLCSKVSPNMACSPRPLLQYVREVCDDVFTYGDFGADNSGKKTNETDKIRRWHKNIDCLVDSIIEGFDDLVIFQECIGTQHLRQLINGILFVYLALYPWCVSNESDWVLLCTNLGLACVFYGLDTVAQELETSIGGGSSPIDIDVRSTFLNFFAAMREEELVRGRARTFFQERAAVGNRSLSELHEDFVERTDRDIAERYPMTPKAALPLGYQPCRQAPPLYLAVENLSALPISPTPSPFFPGAPSSEEAMRKAASWCSSPKGLNGLSGQRRHSGELPLPGQPAHGEPPRGRTHAGTAAVPLCRPRTPPLSAQVAPQGGGRGPPKQRAVRLPTAALGHMGGA